MKPKDYYLRYDHFLKLDLNKVSSFKVIKDLLGQSENILDIGCGVGHLTAFWQATGVDSDPGAIELARKRFPKSKFILADITKKMPFKNYSFNAIICYNILEHLPEKGRENFFRETKRILKKEGIIISAYIDEDFWFNRFLTKLFKDYGINDPTHLVSWKVKDFREVIGKHFKIVDIKKTSPYGRFIFVTKFLKGERVILAKML